MDKPPTVPPLLKDPRNKPEFDVECLTEIPHVVPGFKTVDDFDWDELDRLLGEAELSGDGYEKLGQALSAVFSWVAADKSRLDVIGRRAVALLWVINPDLFEGRSLSKIARQLGLPPSHLCAHSGEASRVFKLRSRAQSHASGNWKSAETIKTPILPTVASPDMQQCPTCGK